MIEEISYDGLYDMKFGDRARLNSFDVWRIPGGWLFSIREKMAGNSLVFVPFDNEFMKLKKVDN